MSAYPPLGIPHILVVRMTITPPHTPRPTLRIICAEHDTGTSVTPDVHALCPLDSAGSALSRSESVTCQAAGGTVRWRKRSARRVARGSFHSLRKSERFQGPAHMRHPGCPGGSAYAPLTPHGCDGGPPLRHTSARQQTMQAACYHQPPGRPKRWPPRGRNKKRHNSHISPTRRAPRPNRGP